MQCFTESLAERTHCEAVTRAHCATFFHSILLDFFCDDQSSHLKVAPKFVCHNKAGVASGLTSWTPMAWPVSLRRLLSMLSLLLMLMPSRHSHFSALL